MQFLLAEFPEQPDSSPGGAHYLLRQACSEPVEGLRSPLLATIAIGRGREWGITQGKVIIISGNLKAWLNSYLKFYILVVRMLQECCIFGTFVIFHTKRCQ